MKTLILTILASVTAFAHAQGADQIYTTVRCERALTVPDLGLSVTVTEGGFAGLTQVHVMRSFLARTSQDTYVVREVPHAPGIMGAPLVLEGDGIRLSVNYTTAPDAKGGHIGYLETPDASGKMQNEELSCKNIEQK